MRKMLRAINIHDFALQSQGPENKVVLPAKILGNKGFHDISVSLYRPNTKHGDPRLWFYEFRRFANPNDVVAVFIHGGLIHALNLTQSDLAIALQNRVSNAITEFIQAAESAASSNSNELLGLLKRLANSGPIKAVCQGDTAVGRSIETALGIAINSSRNPDYKGIEIKSGRSAIVASRENRATLFACVPDWDLSVMKSSRSILDQFGYQRGDDFKLYCTVSTRRANSQGLQFEVKDADKWLREFCATEPVKDVCIWRLDRLHERLSKKHRDTFWVQAEAFKQTGHEWFRLKSVTHTTRPSVEQFDRLLTDGTITMDHLIKRTIDGRVSEKGPLFKIEKPRIGELFLGVPKHYTLAP